MKKLLYIALMMVLAGTLSCHRTSDVEARLIAIDSLIGTAPDSALVLLEEISPSKTEAVGVSMAGEDASRQKLHYSSGESPGTKGLTPASRMTQSEHAYHALLTAQALYKAYIPATSDSLINLAWDYYKDHGPYDRRIRAMLYKGTTAEELGQPDSAMRWYKRTELESRPDDHYHRGYALMSMGILYQNEALSPLDAKIAYSKAVNHYFNDRYIDTTYYLYCLSQLGVVYSTINNDSSILILKKALTLSRKYQDSSLINENLISLAGRYLMAKNYKKSIDFSLEAIKSNILEHKQLLIACYVASLSYCNLGNLDSAQFYYNTMPLSNDINDSSKLISVKAEIEGLKGNEQYSIQLERWGDSVVASHLFYAHNNNLKISE